MNAQKLNVCLCSHLLTHIFVFFRTSPKITDKGPKFTMEIVDLDERCEMGFNWIIKKTQKIRRLSHTNILLLKLPLCCAQLFRAKIGAHRSNVFPLENISPSPQFTTCNAKQNCQTIMIRVNIMKKV